MAKRNLKKGCWVKKGFKTGEKSRKGRAIKEHMWVKITKITENGIEGKLDNKPVLATKYKLNQHVRVRNDEIEASACSDADFKRARRQIRGKRIIVDWQ